MPEQEQLVLVLAEYSFTFNDQPGECENIELNQKRLPKMGATVSIIFKNHVTH